MVAESNTQAQKTAQVLLEELEKNAKRFQAVVDGFAVDVADPAIGSTPKYVVWKRGKSQLFRYYPQTAETHPVPYLIVPWLGISRTHVLDLLPGNSYIESLLKQGYDVYLLDWGEIAEEDKNLGFEDAVFKILPRIIDRALEISQAEEVTLNGICVGGTIAAAYLALEPRAPVRNFVAMVAPIDFDEGGLFKSWLDERYFPVDLIVDRLGGIPASLMAAGFKMLRPTGDIQAKSSLWLNLDRPGSITSFKAMNRWATNYIAMPGRFFSQLTKDLYFNNRMIKGQFMLEGNTVDLSRISCPLLVIAARQDFIVPPLAAKGLMDAVSSEDKEYVELPGGHISVFSGRQAHRTLWPKIDEWLSARAE